VIALDSSAVVAILKKERDADRLTAAMVADSCVISAVSYLESCLVMIGRGSVEAGSHVDTLLQLAAARVVPFDLELAAEARAAFGQFGKGRHPAGLNFGDCAAYALARRWDIPLLFKGTDFAKTDIRPALT
jgi:ribonuclease VapC